MNILNQLNDLVNQAIETAPVDMTQTGTGGGSGNTVLETGSYYGHFIEYIELGKQIPMMKGKPTGKPAALEVKVAFKLYHGDEVCYLRPMPMMYSNGEKANFKRLFDRMNQKGDIKHMAQKLGQPFKIEVTKEESKQTKGKFYNKLNVDTVSALPKFDPETGEPIQLPALDEKDVKLFLWNNPTQETWDALHIESSNFIQESILKAVDYNGSPLQALLEGSVPDLGSAPAAPTAPAPEATAAPVAPQAPAAPVAPAAPTV